MAEEKNFEEQAKELTAKVEELMKQIDSLKADNEKLKAAVSKASSEAADYKKQYRATLDEAGRKEAEMSDARKAMEEELAKLKTDKRIADYTAKFMDAGYEAEMAALMAQSLPEGIGDDFFSQHKKFLEEQKALAKKEALNNQPNLTNGQPPASSNEPDDKLKRYFGL